MLSAVTFDVLLWVGWAKQLPLLGAAIALGRVRNLEGGWLPGKKNHQRLPFPSTVCRRGGLCLLPMHELHCWDQS
ncbi:hypothetical protein SynBIOSU31_00289 [Synechococcus sp. BIOS-U3-1]|nr:hypothetical protein SynBIOSU31_00289 [Synechococcus sp. BIOS-U3-1]